MISIHICQISDVPVSIFNAVKACVCVFQIVILCPIPPAAYELSNARASHVHVAPFIEVPQDTPLDGVYASHAVHPALIRIDCNAVGTTCVAIPVESNRGAHRFEPVCHDVAQERCGEFIHVVPSHLKKSHTAFVQISTSWSSSNSYQF